MKFVVPAENNSLKPSTHKSTDNMILIRDQVREEPLQVADGRAAGAEDDSQPKIKELGTHARSQGYRRRCGTGTGGFGAAHILK